MAEETLYTETEMQAAIRNAAQTAIREFAYGPAMENIIESAVMNALERYGVNTKDPKAAQAEMATLRSFMDTMQLIKINGIGTVIKTLVTGALAALVVGAGIIFTRSSH